MIRDADDTPRPTRPEGVSEAAIVRVIRVPPEAAGTRLDVFLPGELRNTSRTRARAIIERSAFSVDAKKLRASDRVRAGEPIVLWREPFDEIDRPGEIHTLFEDEHILVVDKPPLMAVHPTARHHQSTVIVQLRARRPDEFLSLVHRIDRETSGLLIVARSRESERAFKRMLEDRSIAVASGQPEAAEEVEKEYLALTWGIPRGGMIELPLELDPLNTLRVKMRVAESGGLEAKTEIEVLETRGRYALCRCRLFTGRQHQIRAHLAATGTPVVGDKLYGPDERLLARAADGELSADDLERLELPRHALHAHRYRLRHAMTAEPLELVSPLAEDLRAFWESK